MKPKLLILFLIFFSCCKNIDNKSLKSKPDTTSLKVENISKPGKAQSNVKYLTIAKKYKFGEFQAEMYKGALADPVFLDIQPGDEEYMAFIRQKCKEKGINFAGHYTIIEKGCGVECTTIYIVDRINGKIFNGVFNDGKYGYKYEPNSRMLIANAQLFVDDKFETYFKYWSDPEFYQWEKDTFTFMPCLSNEKTN